MTERRKLGHDVRNEMNTLLLNAQCLFICSGSEAVECVDAIMVAADAIVSIVDQLALLPDKPE